jgi:hypothetical protein
LLECYKTDLRQCWCMISSQECCFVEVIVGCIGGATCVSNEEQRFYLGL